MEDKNNLKQIFSIHHIGGRSGSISFPLLPRVHASMSCTSYDADEDCCPQIEEELHIPW